MLARSTSPWHLLRSKRAHPGSLQYIAAALLNTIDSVPFEVTGMTRALAFHSCGEPKTELHLETGHLVFNHERTRTKRKQQILIKMLAAPVNPADINQVQGTYPLPEQKVHIAGNEGVGCVEYVGSGVRKVQVGDWVIPRRNYLGTWREQIVCLEDDVTVVPKTLPLHVAASLKVNPPTAYRLLRDFVTLRAGDVVLQNGANSAVGRYVIQMCREMGVKTINIVRDRPNYEDLEKELRALGATAVVKSSLFPLCDTQTYLREQLELPSPRLALNCVGGAQVGSMVNFIADGGSLVTYGGMSRKASSAAATLLIFRDIRFLGFWMSRWYDTARPQKYQAMMADLIGMFQRGVLVPPKMQEFQFATEWKEAVLKYSDEKLDRPGVTSDAKPLLIIKEQPRASKQEAEADNCNPPMPSGTARIDVS